MKLLNGKELAGFIKERQATEVRRLKQSLNVYPELAIVHETKDPSALTYTRLKTVYGDDIGVKVSTHFSSPSDTIKVINDLNNGPHVHAIIAQLPLDPHSDTASILNTVIPTKDVDGLGVDSKWQPATPTAIMWLLSGYDIDLIGKRVAIIGKGRLVGAPLAKMLKQNGVEPTVFDSKSGSNIGDLVKFDVVISATGQPGLIKSDFLKPGAIVVDAGTASDGGAIKGDLADEVYDREDLTLTPKKGGVGPLTVCALFDNVLHAARNSR